MPARPETHIQAYALYGESAHLPDVVHCETIATRSALHDWELSVHRHPHLHQVLVLRQGGGTARLDAGVFALRPRTVVNVPPGTVHGFSFQPGTEGTVVTMADELLTDLLARVGDTRRVLASAAVASSSKSIERTCSELNGAFAARNPARALVLRGLCATLLGLAAQALGELTLATRVANLDASDQQPSPLLQRFEALLELHHLAHWSVADYARALAISPTHLSRITRAATGASASRLIHERLMREARSQLAYTRLRVKTVADALGFADPAHFTRVFTRHAGVSPRRYRDRLAAGTPASAGV